MGHNNPFAKEIITVKLCDYGCNQVAKFEFRGGKLCCKKHYNSCPGKRQTFSDRTDHAARTAKSLKTRIELGITKTSQIKGGQTRRENGHYKTLAVKMQQHWKNQPWQNSSRCPILQYRDTDLYFQGTYEFEFLEELESKFGINWITEHVTRGPNVWYSDPTNGEMRLYMSDFLIDGTVYEIKSGWTWNKHGRDLLLEEKNKAKLKACVSAGYNVVLVLNQQWINYNEIMD